MLMRKRVSAAGDDPRLRVLDWDAMRVDGRAIDELAKALHGNTNLRQLRLQRNRDLTDNDLSELDEALRTQGCGVTEVLCAVGTGVSEAKVNALSQFIDIRRLHADDPDLTEIAWSRRESSDLEGMAKLRLSSFVDDEGADVLLQQSSAQLISSQILVNRRTCKLLGTALRGSTHLRVIDLGNNAQLHDSGAAFIVEALSESKVVRVWAAQTSITKEMSGRIDRLCVENALQQLSEDDPACVALHWFGLHLTNQEILDCTCFHTAQQSHEKSLYRASTNPTVNHIG
jgi:hypothetical protein